MNKTTTKKFLLFIALFLILILTISQTLFAQTNSIAKIELKSRTIMPIKKIDTLTIDKIHQTPQEKAHILLVLDRIPTKEKRLELKDNKIELLAYIHNKAWIASVDKNYIDNIAELKDITWIGEIQRNDKISPEIINGFPKHAKNTDGTVSAVIVFYKDVKKEDINKFWTNNNNIKVGKAGMLNDYVIKAKDSEIYSLADNDIVQWIESIPGPDEDGNDGARAAVGVNALQTAPYNLNGTGIRVGQWESGNPETNHTDLVGRVTLGENVGTSFHATHVAGTVGGTGNLGDGTYRGMATNVTFYSYSTTVDDLEPEDHNDAITNHDIDLSTNSWGSSGSAGSYSLRSAKYDNVTIGTYGKRIPIIFIAHNDGPGWGTVRKPGATAKNTIVVGATDSNDNAIMDFSNRGPTDDGRLKPDVVAPGCQNKSYYDTHTYAQATSNESTCIWSASDGNTYAGGCGTSMAGPVVSGSVSLMLEQFDNIGHEPLPSTVKAILIHTAHDLDRSGNGTETNDGPDFVNGWGLINATRSIDLILNHSDESKRFIESNITNQGDVKYYSIPLNENRTELKVTLVWDDIPGVPNDGVKELQNDLDLYLIDPNGDIHRPWLLDSANPANAATTGIDDLNTVEQVLIRNESGLLMGTWQIVINGTEVPEPDQPFSLIIPYYASSPIHATVLLLDTSGSMSWDPNGNSGVPDNETRIYKAKQASFYFLDMLNLYKEDNTSIGVAIYPESPWTTCSISGGEVIFNLTQLDDSNVTKNNAILAIDALTAYGGTPMQAGIETAKNMLNFDAADKSIVLLSDGYHNCPNTNFDMSIINDSSIQIYTLAYGNQTQVNHELLENISNVSGAGEENEGFFVAENSTLLDLVPVFKSVITNLLGLYAAVDPPVTINSGNVNNHEVSITEYDDKVAFTISWADAQPQGAGPALQLKLQTPSGVIIDPLFANSNNGITYIQRETYQVYFVEKQFIGNANLGSWKLIVDAGNLKAGTEALYHYGVIMKSDLKMDVTINSGFRTGNVINIIAKSNKASLTAPTKIKVKIKSPVESLGTWYVKNTISNDEIEKIKTEKDGDLLSGTNKKALALMDKNILPTNKKTETTISLFDDGKHGDGKANDGVYANSFTETRKTGVYSFDVLANGRTGKNIQFTRQQIIKRHVNILPDLKSTIVNVRSLKGTVEYSITLTPKDLYGNYLGPGYSNLIRFNNVDRTSEIIDNLDGSYTQNIKIDPKTTKITANVNGVEMVIDLKEDKFPLWIIILIIVIILLIVLFFVIKRKKN